jgi:two-component system response regulator RegX3
MARSTLTWPSAAPLAIALPRGTLPGDGGADGEPPRNVYESGRLRIDFDAYEVWVDGRPVHLLRREFQLLRFFVRSANRVFDRAQILAHVWPEARVNQRTVDVHVYRLRRCIERDPVHPEILVTVRGVGWKFNERAL